MTKYLIDYEGDDGIVVIDDTDVRPQHDEVHLYKNGEIDAVGVRTRFNSAAVIRPMLRGTEVCLDIIDNTIKSIEDLLVDMRVERMTLIEHAYQNSGQYVHTLEDGTMEVRDRPKPPVPANVVGPVPVRMEGDDKDW